MSKIRFIEADLHNIKEETFSEVEFQKADFDILGHSRDEK